MDWYPIIILAFMVFIFAIFLALWLAGVFTTQKPGVTGTSNETIQKYIDVIMPPSVWSGPTAAGTCLIYNFPIVGNTFPKITNNPEVIKNLQTTSANRCYWSNELALMPTKQTCIADECLDDLGNSYSRGQVWNYYGTCAQSCYAVGQFLTIIAIGIGSTSGTVAIARRGGGSAIGITPALDDSDQYHIIAKYKSSSLTRSDPGGHLCNITHYLSGEYLGVLRVEFEGDVYYVPAYFKGRPTKALWLMAPPNSIGGVSQPQRLVYVGDITIKNNPTLFEYCDLVQNNNLRSIVYGLNFNIKEPFVGLFMVRAFEYAVSDVLSANSQFIDISRFSLLINASTFEYPYYRWSQV